MSASDWVPANLDVIGVGPLGVVFFVAKRPDLSLRYSWSLVVASIAKELMPVSQVCCQV